MAMPPPPSSSSSSPLFFFFFLNNLMLLLLLLLLAPCAASSLSTPHNHTHRYSQTQQQLQSPPESPLPPPPPPSAPRPPHRHHRNPPPQLHSTPPPPTLTSTTPPPTPTTPLPVPAPPAPAPPPTPTPKFPSSFANPAPDAYPFTNYPFFPSFAAPPPPAQQQPSSAEGGLPTFPANISTLVHPTPRAPRRFPVLQALLLSLLSLCLLLLSALLSLHLFRRLRLRHRHRSRPPSSSAAAHRPGATTHDDDDDGDGDEEGRRLKPPPMPTSSSNPSTEFLYLGTLAAPPPQHPPPTTSHLRPGSPELRPLPPLPRVGPPSGEFASRSSASDPSTAPPAAAEASSSYSSLSPSSPSASSPTLGSSPVHPRPPSIQQPRGRDPNPSPPKRRPQPPEAMAAHAWNPFVPMPPQAPPSEEEDSPSEKSIRKSRPLHSDKLKPGSLHMKDEMIHLYLNNSTMAAAMPREVCLLGAPRCHGIGMLVGALGISKEQVREAILEGNAHGLGVEALRMLMQMTLTNEEELKLKYFKDDLSTKLCPVEAFLKAVLDVPFAFKRMDAMLYVANFYLEVNQLRMSYATLEAACQELKSSRLFHKVLEAVLNFGNLMSINTGSPDSHAMEPNTLLKIVDVKGTDGKAALLQYVVQEIVKPEGDNPVYKMNASSTLQYDVECRKHGLQVMSKLAAELSNTKKASSIDMMKLSRDVSELGVGLGKIHDVLRLNSMVTSADSARRFHNAMSTFLRQAEEEILKLQAQESICLSCVKEVSEYFFQGESSSEEGQMVRVFGGVREFLGMLDRICKEAGEEMKSGGWMGRDWNMAAPMGMTTP